MLVCILTFYNNIWKLNTESVSLFSVKKNKSVLYPIALNKLYIYICKI